DLVADYSDRRRSARCHGRRRLLGLQPGERGRLLGWPIGGRSVAASGRSLERSGGLLVDRPQWFVVRATACLLPMGDVRGVGEWLVLLTGPDPARATCI